MEKFVLIYGETQAGKSTFVNAINEQKVAESGSGNGLSVTSIPSVHSKQFMKNIQNGIPANFKLFMMDTPGNLDTQLRWSDDIILKNIQFAITSSSRVNKIDVIFLAESLATDSMQLTRNLQKLKNLFGPKVMKSIVVLGLKPELSKRMFEDSRRIDAVSAECRKLGVPFLIYESRKAHNWYNNQFKSFMNKIFDKSVQPYEMNEIDQIRQRIESRAQQLMRAAPKQYRTVNFTVQVDKLEPYQTQETYTDVESYQAPETYYANEWKEIGRGGRRYGVAGPKKAIYGWVAVAKSRTVTKTRPVQKTRSVTKYRSKKVNENRTRQDEIPKNIDKYRMNAQREWEQQMKNSIQIRVNIQ